MNGKKQSVAVPEPVVTKSDPFGSIEGPDDILNVIDTINTKLPDLDQLRWVLKDHDAIKKANDGMWSLTNSFKRLAVFLSQKLEDINQQNLAKQHQEKIEKSNKNKEKFEEDYESPDLGNFLFSYFA